MPPLADLTAVRALLNRDRPWAAYAIGDLAPGYVEHAEWLVPPDGFSALVLVYRGFDLPIVFSMGDAHQLSGLFGEISPREISLHIRPEALEPLRAHYALRYIRPMLRMIVEADAFRPASGHAAAPIGEADALAVAQLYDDGHHHGEGPTFFVPAMLRQNTFQGIWEGGALVSIAGTHLYSREEGVCAIGNIYTHSDHRGRGLGACVTSAIVANAIADGISTIILNVGHVNVAAQRVYRRLGFRDYCEFVEGEAVRGAGSRGL